MAGGFASAVRGGATVVRTPGVTIFFQCYPGVHGTEAQRGIANVPFTATVPGMPAPQNGFTGQDGGISISVPVTTTQCTLRIFGVDYTLRIQDDFPMLARPGDMRGVHDGDHDDGYPTIAELLYWLGYHRPASIFPFSTEMNRELDKAILDFQVNEDLPPRADGTIGQGTWSRMTLRYGQHV